MNTPETFRPTERDPKYGYPIDGRIVQFWGSRDRANAGARAIGWPTSSVTKVFTRFQLGYALMQSDSSGLLTRVAYERLQESR